MPKSRSAARRSRRSSRPGSPARSSATASRGSAVLATAATGVAPRRRDLDFQLFEVLDVEALLRLPYFAEHDRATLTGVLDAAYEVAGDYFAPTAAELDAFEFRLDGGEVATPAALKTAVRAYVDAGFMGATFSAADGGLQLPATLSSAAAIVFTAAEHDLSENIVNLVLAKLPDAPPGVKGISLFIVPKFLLDANGGRGRRNGVQVTGLNHKLGQRGVVNTVLTFGDDCVGYLVGAPHDGMRQMFHMMNEARIAVGAGAAALSLAAYEYSLHYAKERPQGRRLTDKDPQAPPVAIVEHADVRRMLLAQKAIAEGSLGLVLYCSHLVDTATAALEPRERDDANLLLDVLTPVAKTWPSERGIESTSLAIQVLGGYGYSPEYPVERHFRDQRLNPIHEGTTGIQGLDLLGRKLRLNGGAGLQIFLDAIARETAAAGEIAAVHDETTALSGACDVLARVTRTLLDAQGTLGPERALAESTAFLDAFGTERPL